MSIASQMTADGYDTKKHPTVAWFVEAAALCVLFLIVDAIVLRCIFPGYLDPFWPHHSDYYMPAALAYSPAGFWQVLSYPRPVGQIFYWTIGHLGTRGSIVGVLLVVAANYALIVMIMRRLFHTPLNAKLLLSGILFAYLLASHPYQYQFSTWDAFTQLSLLLLLLAITLRMQGLPWWMSAALVLLAFLAKETFILSATLLAVAWLSSRRFRGGISFAPLIIVGCAGVLALIIGHLTSSPFTTGGSQAGGTYEIVLSAHSVASEWLQYLIEGMNWLGLAVIILTALAIALAFGIRSSEFLWSIALPIAGLLAWLPNSVLPKHHFAFYTWNSAYLLYAPVIALALIAGRSAFVKAISAMIAIMAIISPALSTSAFANQDWVIMNQKRQKQLLLTLDGLMKQLPGEGKTVLISGINFPYSPFEYKDSIRSMVKPANTKFFVVAYEKHPVVALTKRINEAKDAVIMIAPDDVLNEKFDQEWLIRSDGTLIKRIADPASQPHWSEGGFTQDDTLKFPELMDLYGPDKREPSGKLDGYGYLDCGLKLLGYNALEPAEKCLKVASSLLPENSYPHYYLGISLERQKKIEEAKNAYKVAVAVQGKSPNPVFQAALDKLQ